MQKPTKERKALEDIHVIIADAFDKDMENDYMDVYYDALVRIENIVRSITEDAKTKGVAEVFE